jgi:ribokinase
MLIVYGDIAVDVVVQADGAPEPGGDASGGHIAILPGGSAANCAVAAARLGTPVQFVGVTGSDYLAEMLVKDLLDNAVGAPHLRRTPAPTAVVVVLINRHGERTFYSFRGAAASAAYGPIAADLLRPGDWLHLSGYSFQDECSRETALALIARGKEVGATISLDPSFHSARDFRTRMYPVLRDIDLLFPNREEAERMTGVRQPAEAAALLRALGPRVVAIKLGSEGCYVASDEGNTYVPAYPVHNVVDTTGAGDAFCGGFLTATLRNMPPNQAARVGHVVAASVIAREGGHGGSPRIAEIIEALDEYGDSALASALAQWKIAP